MCFVPPVNAAQRHTYTAGEVVQLQGNNGLVGKASIDEEGVVANGFALSKQNIPAMQGFPWLAPPTLCSYEIWDHCT